MSESRRDLRFCACRKLFPWVFLLATLAALSAPATARAQAPANDACADATPATLGQTRSTLVGATNDGGASEGSAGQPDVWYRFRAAASGTLYVSTCGTNDLPAPDEGLDTVLSIHFGCPGNVENELVANDDFTSVDPGVCSTTDTGAQRDSYVSYPLRRGVEAFIRVSRYDASTDGDFLLNVAFDAGAMTNDSCDSPLWVSEGTLSFNNDGATTDGPDEPRICAFSGYTQVDSDLWFRYQPSCTGVATVSLCGSTFDTKVAVYEGPSCPSPRLPSAIACNDDSEACGTASEVRFAATADSVYLLRVGGYQGQQGDGVLTIRCDELPPVLSGVSPPLVSTLGGTLLAVTGERFGSATSVEVGGVALTAPELVDPTTIRGRAPALAAGRYDVTLREGRTVVDTLPGAVEAAPPPQLEVVVPSSISTEGGTAIEIRGAELRVETVFSIGVVRLDPIDLRSSSLALATAPPLGLAAGPGPRDVTAADSRGRATLPGGVTYVEPTGPVMVTSCVPARISYLGQTPVEVRGRNFTASTRVVMTSAGWPGRELTVEYVNAGSLRITPPPDPVAVEPGGSPSARIEAIDPINGSGALDDAFRYEGPLGASGVEPSVITVGAAGAVTVLGVGFTPATQATIGGLPVAALSFVDASTLAGSAPDLPAGSYPLVVSDTLAFGDAITPVSHTLPNAVTYVEPIRLTLSSLWPATVSYLGKATVEVRGSGFTADTVFRATTASNARALLPATVVSDTLARAILPSEPTPGAVQHNSLSASDPAHGADSLADAFTYSFPLRAESAIPGELTVGAGGIIEVTGTGFTPETAVTIGGRPLIDPAPIDPTRMRGQVPDLPAGTYDLVADDILDFGGAITPVSHTLPGAVRYVDPVRVALAAASPREISYLGKTTIEVTGSGFTADTIFELQSASNPGVPIPAEVASDTLALLVPPADPDPGTAQHNSITALDPDRGDDTLADAFTYSAPLRITLVTPEELTVGVGGTLEVVGTGFSPETVVTLGDRPLVGAEVIGPTKIRGSAPDLAAGLYSARVSDTLIHGGATTPVSHELPDAVRLISPITLELLSVTPAVVSYLGKTEVLIRGGGFTAATSFRLTTSSHSDLNLAVTVESDTSARAVLPAEPSFEGGRRNTISARDPEHGSATLADAFRYDGPLAATSASPRELFRGEATDVEIRGSGFTPETEVKLGGLALGSPELLDSGRIRGVVPALPKGTHDVVVSDILDAGGEAVVVSDTLHGAIDVFDRDGSPCDPAPREVETAVAEGVVRLSWHNPGRYEEVRVRDRATGAVLATLPGNATRYEFPMPEGEESLSLEIQGVSQTGVPTAAADALVAYHDCDRPAPLNPGGRVGDLNLSVRGGAPRPAVTRCTGGGGGAGGGGAAARGDGAGGGIPASAGLYTMPDTSVGEVGLVIPESITLDPFSNRLTTGFRLAREADKLEIAGYYQKIATEFGLRLKGRLRRVWPREDFEDEFTFPRIAISEADAAEPALAEVKPSESEDKNWHSVIYFRADRDPTDPQAQPCGTKIPAGEYVLDVFAVGGNINSSYYLFANDERDDQILIPQVPCPPYPLVRVRDLTGLATLPQISSLEVAGIVPDTIEGGVMSFCLTAHGTWLDETNQPFRIDPWCSGTDCLVPYRRNPHVIYEWSLKDRNGRIWTTKTGTSNRLRVERGDASGFIMDWGCTSVEITVRDLSCDTARIFPLQFALVPPRVSCDPQYLSFHYPTPDPGGLTGLVGLIPEPGDGFFRGERPVEFRVLVVPSGACASGGSPCEVEGCPAAVVVEDSTSTNDDFELRLVARPFAGDSCSLPRTVELAGPDDLTVSGSECASVDTGPRFFKVTLPDLGAIDFPPGVSVPDDPCVPIVFQARCRRVRVLDASRPGGQRLLATPNAPWVDVGNPMRVARRPFVLERSHWAGYYEERDDSYHFDVYTDDSPSTSLDMGQSSSIPLELGQSEEVSVPSYSNEMASGFTSRFQLRQGVWVSDRGSGDLTGQAFGNKLDGVPIQVEPASSAGQGGGGGSTSYKWCKQVEIFKRDFSQKIFEAIIYTGTIGPVPVTLWASVSFGVKASVDALVGIELAPFNLLGDGSGATFQSRFALLSNVQLYLPATVRADILYGIASLGISLIPETDIYLDFFLKTDDLNVQAGYYAGAFFKLLFRIKACVLKIFCLSFTKEVVPQQTILSSGTCVRDSLKSQFKDCMKGIKGCPLPPGGGAGGGAAGPPPFFGEEVAAPTSVLSPSSTWSLLSYVQEDGTAIVTIERVNDGTKVWDGIVNPLDASPYRPLRDPAAAFLSDDLALVVSTVSRPDLVPGYPFADTTDPHVIASRSNLLLQQEDLRVELFTNDPGGWSRSTLPGVGSNSLLTGDAILNGAQGRADGMAAVAADFAGGEAWVAWVRYETASVLLQSGTTRVPHKQADGTFTYETVPNYQPQLNQTSVFARKVGSTGAVGPAVRLSPPKSGPGGAPSINIEPALAGSPDGRAFLCVWVHDPTHANLIETNKGRRLLYSVHQKGAGIEDTTAWTAPASVLANAADYDAVVPGVLEPALALRDGRNGLLAFTALDPATTDRDTGLLGANRYVYLSRLIDGVFHAPERLTGICDRRILAIEPTVILPHEKPLQRPPGIRWRLPEVMLVVRETGPLGTRRSSGNVLISAGAPGGGSFLPPVNLTPDESIHSNVVAAGGRDFVRTVSFNGGAALLSEATAAGAGGAAGPGFEVIDAALEPDPAVTGCRVDRPFAAPGSLLRLESRIENRGLAYTPTDDGGQSLVGWRAVYVETSGDERVVATGEVPELAPGEDHVATATLEMPLDPVILRVELAPNPIDRAGANNSRECFLGTPPPGDFACSFLRVGGEGEPQAASLRWSNRALYDDVYLYRDGTMLARVPGGEQLYVDTTFPPGAERVQDSFRYEVRGRIGSSFSPRAQCVAEVKPPVVEPVFRRGDSNADARVDISDGINIFLYLFVGGPAPLCPDAADTNDEGAITITSGIYLLNHLFKGGPPLAPPGMDACGVDPTPEDRLGPCGYPEEICP